MKKIMIILIVFLGILFGNTWGVFAENNYKWQPVFKIYNYYYDEWNKIYFIQSYGSAVYLWNNKIVTNNHVVKDQKWGYTWFYEICETRNFTKKPVCFTSAKLLYIDKTKDLAFLKLDIKPNSDKKIEFSNKEISIWDKIETYWYPSNWGETITFTSGKISGFESEKYKIDASVDSWSSGWWAFDEDWNLVWITTSVVSWYTTLWYIVPTKDIKSFLLKKWNITTLKTFNTVNFKEFLKKYQKRINSDEISTEYIEVKNISKYGFSIFDDIFDKKDEINKYYLSSKTGLTYIYISTNVSNTKKSKFTEEDYKELSKILNLKKITEQFIYNNWKKFYYWLELNKETKYIKITFSRNSISYVIEWNLNEKNEIKNALELLFNNSKIKNNIMNYSDNLFIDWVTINNNSGFELNKYLWDDLKPKILGLKKVWQNTFLQLIINNNKLIKLVEKPSLNKVLENNKKMYSWKNIYSDALINSKWKLFYYIKIKSNKFILYKFVTETEYDGYFYNYSFNIFILGLENTNIDNSIKNFINNLDFKWKEIFSDKEIKNAWIKNISEITFNNNIWYIIENNASKNSKTSISKKDAFKILQKISWKDIIFSNIEDQNSSTFKLRQAYLNLSKSKNWDIYIKKIWVIISKLKIEKLKKISAKLEKLDFNNSRIKKYKLILEYMKYKVLVELEDRK